MPCCHIRHFQRPCLAEQAFKFHIAVAVDTGIRRKALLIGTNEPLHHFFFKVRRHIQHIMRTAEPRANTARILNIV